MPSAFPGAYGWGAGATGGRGGSIRVVSNTNESGGGSFKTAVATDGPAIVVFTVSGVIALTGGFDIVGKDLTIAGQTAPGGGITLGGAHPVNVKKDNVIIRYLSFREPRLIIYATSDGVTDVIVDHCSFSWGADDMLGIWYSDDGESWPDVQNITVQNCLFAQALSGSQKNLLAGGGTGGDDSLADHVHEISVCKNLFVNTGWRNPFLKCAAAESINNVTYNYVFGSGMCGENNGSITDKSDWIANQIIAGNLESEPSPMIHYPNKGEAKSSIYIRSNITSGVYPSDITDPEADNWPLLRKSTDYSEADADQKRSPWTQQPQPTYPVSEVSAAAALSRVPAWAGNIHRLESDGTYSLRRDTFDQAQVDNVEEDDGGIEDLPASAGDMPTLAAGTAYTDTDGDGMADEWELANGLDPNDLSDGPIIRANGYSNLEHFLNGMQLEQASRLSVGVNITAKITGEFIIKNEEAIEEFWRGYFADIQSAVSGIAKTIGNGDET